MDEAEAFCEEEPPISQDIHEGALQLGRMRGFEETHGVQVARLALSVFDQTGELHGLGERDRNILLAASILHDIGVTVSYEKHHKHSRDIILRSGVPGFTEEEVCVIANIARYHRKKTPSTEHGPFRRLSAPDRERVKKLSSILRIADGLDRSHSDSVSCVKVEAHEGVLLFRIRGRGDMLLETWAFEKKSRYFGRLFDTGVRHTAEG